MPCSDYVSDGQTTGVRVGACPGHEERVGINRNHRAPSGNRQMRRLLNQAAHAAVKTKGSIFELLYRRFVGRLGHAQAIGAIAHRLCRLVWKILHQASPMRNAAPLSARRGHSVEPLRWFANSVVLATTSNSPWHPQRMRFDRTLIFDPV